MGTILTTGGTGFIGSHTCLVFLNAGFNIVILDSLLNSSEKILQRISQLTNTKNVDVSERLKFYKGDIRDTSLLDQIFREAELNKKPIFGVMHFAGLKAVGESSMIPLDYWEVNVGGTINILKIMDNYNCHNFVFSSSAAIYGGDNNNPKEDSIRKPVNPYGKSKLAVENILNDLYLSSPDKWKVAVLRYFNPIGAHESGLLGEDPNIKATNIFPDICRVASGKKKIFNVYGKDWPTPDGTGIRDYIHVMDLADGHFEAMKYLFENEHQIIYLNLGTGIGTSVLELIRAFEESNSIKVPYKFSERRIGDVPNLVANNNLALSKLNWSPKRNINKMCIDSWNWYMKNLN